MNNVHHLAVVYAGLTEQELESWNYLAADCQPKKFDETDVANENTITLCMCVQDQVTKSQQDDPPGQASQGVQPCF